MFNDRMGSYGAIVQRSENDADELLALVPRQWQWVTPKNSLTNDAINLGSQRWPSFRRKTFNYPNGHFHEQLIT